MATQRALVTGGAGFIGSHLARRLLERGWSVVIIDNLSTGSTENIPSKAEFLEIDLSHDNFTEKLPEQGVDVVFHLAAQSSGEISFDDPMYDLKTNCLSTVALLDWCVRKKIPRFIYTSSMSIYGDISDHATKETEFPIPKSFYGIGKLASENYMRIYQQQGVNCTALRLFNVYGPGQNMENLRQGMVSIYMSYIAKNVQLIVKGSKDRFRDLVYIDDVIDAFLLIIDNPQTYGQSYNVGTGRKTHVWEMIKEILENFSQDPDTYPIEYQENTPGDVLGTYADISKIRNAVNWSPKIKPPEGIRLMANWVKQESA